ncbi:transposable element tc1 [Fusarium langsethiae]|uniref:Transposable element tc1 n=1 Tax=Fusarium langsethiae TaxID=179993 RepID=A0A0M9EMX3_FUSLA|nr:transposable element tc1 [Fusarium langsethiae]
MSEKDGILSILYARRQSNHEFDPTIKALIVQAIESGRSYRAVATEVGSSPGAIFKVVQRWKTERTLDRKCRPGRPRKLSRPQIRW